MADTLRRPAQRALPRRLSRCAIPLTLVFVTACAGADGGQGRPGAQSAGDSVFPRLGNGGYRVEHYGLTLDYRPEGNLLAGKAVITARATQDLSAFSLDFKGMRLRDTRVEGKPAHTSRRGTKLTVRPRHPVAKGARFTTEISYRGTPQTVQDADGATEGWVETEHGAVGLGEPEGSMAWFPGNHHPSNKAAYDFTVTVPKGYTAVANGELRNQQTKDGKTTFVWHNGEPMAGYVASVAVGEFQVTRGRAGRLPLYIASVPGEEAAAGRMRQLLPRVLDWETGLFGPYPFASAGAVIDRNSEVHYALETQTKPYYQEPPSDKLVVHEMAHQWFGNSVTPRDWRDMWLNEAFAQYAEWMWEEKQGGRTVRQTFDDYYDGKDPESKGPAGEDIWSYPPATPNAEQISGRPVYGRSAMMLQRLREIVGDRVFFDILRSWVSGHRHGNADAGEFFALCKAKSGKELGDFFRTWLYMAGKPPRS
ncbi:M1 family metallopeptidase [Streptomyces orinoci]|uniref:Aminopeptidase N n=1 Tax=Streptomyces orinoci TaxID=67339 RepID=A0ABV3JVJ3_STRON|nr:M1 family metallopeptidase [Streptomyces orinoci]